MNLFEFFTSIQGEGFRVGRFTTFVRFGGCNLHCSWCDEPNSIPLKRPISEQATPRGIYKLIRVARNKDVCFTGGEPTIQPAKELAELCDILQRHKYFMTIETNGTRYVAELMPYIDLWSISPKLSSSENNLNHHAWMNNVARIAEHRKPGARIQLKFVIGSVDDLLESRQYIDAFPRLPVFLQSVWLEDQWAPKYTVNEIQNMLEQSGIDYKKRDIRFGVQLHKYCGVK